MLLLRHTVNIILLFKSNIQDLHPKNVSVTVQSSCSTQNDWDKTIANQALEACSFFTQRRGWKLTYWAGFGVYFMDLESFSQKIERCWSKRI